MSSAQYDEAFYRDAADAARRSARVVVPLLLGQMQVASVADVGCVRQVRWRRRAGWARSRCALPARQRCAAGLRAVR